MRVAFTIIFNGKHHYQSGYDDYIAECFDHWIIAEGAVSGEGGTSWYNKIPDDFHNNGNSNDGTLEHIKMLSKKHENVHVIEHTGFWKNKEEQVNACIHKLRTFCTPCYLWEIDADEQWDIKDIEDAEKDLDRENGKTGIVRCVQFVGENLVSKGEWGDDAPIRRLWKWNGELFKTHAPPTLEGGNGKEVLLSQRFYHYSYYYEKDVLFKNNFYTGHDDIYNKWKSLQKETVFPQPISRLISGYWGTTKSEIVKLGHPYDTIDFIIPYRDRPENLDGLIQNIKKFYYSYCNYNIIVCEQNDDKPFLRGQLFNLGFNKSRSEMVVLMDVDIRFLETIDLIKEMNEHDKPFLPWNNIAEIKKEENGEFEFTGEVDPHVVGWGGCFVCTREHFEKFGGFSNLVFGWGGEDNIVYKRCKHAGLFFKGEQENLCTANKLDFKMGHISHKKNNNNSLYLHNNSILYNHSYLEDDTHEQTIADYEYQRKSQVEHYKFSNIGVTEYFKYKDKLL